MFALLIGICVASLVVATIALMTSVNAWTDVKAMKGSTHSMMFFDPTKQEFQKVTDAELNKMVHGEAESDLIN